MACACLFTSTGAPRVQGKAAPQHSAGLALDTLALERLQVSPELAGQVASLSANLDMQRIEARLSGLEHSVAATLDVLNQLLNAVRRDPPPEERT